MPPLGPRYRSAARLPGDHSPPADLRLVALHLAALILLDIAGYTLFLPQQAHSRPLNVGDMDERAGSAALGRLIAEAL